MTTMANNRQSILEYVQYTFDSLSPEYRTERVQHYIDSISYNAKQAYRQTYETADMKAFSSHYINVLNESKFFFFCAHYLDVEIDFEA